MIICNNERCVFHKAKSECLLPDDKNFRIAKKGVVVSCLNHIQNEKDLSHEGKERLKRLKGC